MKETRNHRARLGLALLASALLLATGAPAAAQAGNPPIFEPVLSLTGDCSTPAPDTVPDPGCPSPPPPGGLYGPSARFAFPEGRGGSVAIDAYGNEYVASSDAPVSGRIDVFDDAGFFLTELATPGTPKSIAVDSEGNLYVLELLRGVYRYEPTAYDPATGEVEYANPGTFVAPPPVVGGLAIDFRDKADVSDDRLYVAEGSQITEYGPAKDGNVPLNTITHPKLGFYAIWPAVDSQRRRFYTSYCKDEVNNCGVLVFEADPPYALLQEIDGSETPAGRFFSTAGWLSIAVDEESGHFFVDDLRDTKNVFEFDQNFELFSVLNSSSFNGGNTLQMALSNSPLDPTARNHRYLFVPVLGAAARVLAFQQQKVCPPVVKEATAANLGETEAELRAGVDPCGADTQWTIEYVSQAEFEAGEWATAQIAGSGTVSKASQPRQVSGLAAGLEPGTAYRFRVRATNEVDEAAAEGSFATYADAPSTGSCPNGPLRTGPSAALPDCRAYELVTPPSTGGLPPQGVGSAGDQFPTLHAAPDGNAVSFILQGGILPGAEGNGGLNGDQYRATRTASGWSTAGLGPSGAAASAAGPGGTSPDQGFSFWSAAVEGPAVIGGNPTHYVRYPDGRLELVGRGSIGTDPKAQGRLITPGGGHIVFITVNGSPFVPQQLEPDAPPTGTMAVYDRTPDEVTHVVSLLPGDVTPGTGESAEYLGASPNGEGIAFEVGGTLYLRKNNAVTYEIGEQIDPAGSFLALAGVSEGGRRVFYLEDGDLLAFDTETGETIEFSQSGDVDLVNVPPGGTRAYFLSPSVLTGEPNPVGDVAQPGAQNLYLSEEGQISFLATVTDLDAEGEDLTFGSDIGGLGTWLAVREHQRAWDPSRTTPDGSVLLFESRANLTGHNPNGSPQVYRYDSNQKRLHCISCIPTGQPASGGASLQSYASSESDPAPFSGFGFVPNLTPDGARAFFQSTEALVSTDVDEVQDVYEWEEEGVGSCTRPGGCVYLISSGHSARDNYLYANSQSGDDVFFTTSDLLTGADAEATPSIYDARVGGGFPEASPEPCQGEGCRPGMAPGPVFAAPESGARAQHGNTPRTCPKGKRKVKRGGKVRCVKKHRKHKQHRKADIRKKGPRK